MDFWLMFFIISGILIFVCKPAKIEFENGMISMTTWPFLKKHVKPIEDIESFRIEMGFYPVYIRFKDGSVMKWTAYPLRKHVELRRKLQKVTGV